MDASKNYWGSLSGNSNRRGMEFTGTTTLYKCFGNEGNNTSLASISQVVSDESYSFQNRHYNSLVVSCKDRGGEGRKQFLIELAK